MEAQDQKMHSPPDVKRRMKTPLQLETLEKVFAEEKYPSEAVRAELSVQLGLSDRQLKMWFNHRRLKDRKCKEDEDPATTVKRPQQKENAPASIDFPASELMDSSAMTGKLCSDEGYKGGNKIRLYDEAASRCKKPAEKRAKDSDSAPRKRSRHAASKFADPSKAAEARAIFNVEAQLGEPVREDGPVLGVEFDPLPPGAFGSLIAPLQHQKSFLGREPSYHMDSKAFERYELKPHKNPVSDQPSHKGGRRRKVVASDSGHSLRTQPGSRALQEYQFIPEQPTGRAEISPAYERSVHSELFLGSENPLQNLTSRGSFLRGGESLASSFGLPGRLPNVGGGLLFHVDGHNNQLFPHSRIDFEGLRQDSFPSFGYDSHFGGHNGSFQQLLPVCASLGSSEKLSLLDDCEPIRTDKKRKSEEARITKEVEAHKKRIRRELERQEVARRKREEQMRKDLERHDREKRREVERMFREKQREDERMQREQRREYERREKLIHKETQRLERQRQKEDIRRLKEATKLKAAIERATARRLARESTELIDDERLELLEAAAMSQGLPSIYLLDGETLQELDRYKDFLKRFPPGIVRMKKPLSVSPWIESQQNVGNLFMVWRFLITFTDVLGLWPFTIDELVQAFHDYDPRLLGEIHMALLRLLVRDIEDVAQASASGGVSNQYTNTCSGGGHPQLVEAAFAWGFDIREWGQYLNPLTWPEVLRQFSLAAGYGPRWKKQQVEVDDSHYDDEGNEGEEAVNTLRSGAAAANAVALMKGKGGSYVRRCRYRLTPGTVKYAAFHVLSVEGANGLSILDVVDRIQKSGLRDLSTSKTPEASIAAALSRDTNFFERVAPSTYCVRPAFRKDPEDAERLLQAARERIHLFQCGISEVDHEKETEDADEAEREEDSDDDMEDAEGDDLQGDVSEGKVVFCLKEGKVIESGENLEKVKRPELLNSNPSTQTNDIDRAYRGKLGLISSVVEINKPVECGSKGNTHLDDLPQNMAPPTDTEIDESHAGEPWVQGLMEGEYSDLSVEERLNALVALVEAVNEGNAIRVALEERMEAANSLKRQMWAEAQLDKRRFREEQLLKSQSQVGEGFKIEESNPNAEGLESPQAGEEKVEEKPILEGLAAEPGTGTYNAVGNSPHREKGAGVQACINQDATTSMAGFSLDKTRAQLKADIGLRAEELYIYRSLPLGFDRRHNRYWQFVTSNAGEDPGCGRIYFESAEDGYWEVIDTEEAFDALMANLDTRGIREANLHGVLLKLEHSIKQAMRKSVATAARWSANERDSKATHFLMGKSPKNQLPLSCHTGYVSEGSSGDGTVVPGIDLSSRHAGGIPIQLNNTPAERQGALERYGEFDKWIWSKHKPVVSGLIASKRGKKRSCDLLASCEVCHEFYWPRDKHCPHCHATYEGFPKADAKFSYHVHVHDCEEKWKRSDASWKLQGPSTSLPSRVQLLKAHILALEVAVPSEALKPEWTETNRKAWAHKLKCASSPAELLQILTELEHAVRRDWMAASYETTEELLEAASLDGTQSTVLPWVPQTTAAVTARLMALDSALFYSVEQKHQSQNEPEKSHYAGGVISLGKVQNVDTEDLSLSTEEAKVDSWMDLSYGQQSGRGRGGRGGRPRGRGRGRGGGNGTTKSASVSGIPKVPRSRLHVSVESQDMLVRNGRGRGRGARTNILDKTVQGRGRGCRSSRRRPSNMHKKGEDQWGSMSMALEGIYEQASEQDIQSDRVSSENDDWDARESSDEQLNNKQVCYNEEYIEDMGDCAEEEDEADREELIVEDEYEEDEDGQFEEQSYARQENVVDSEDIEVESVEEAEEEAEEEDENEDEDDDEGDGDGHVRNREDNSFDSQSSEESD